jgi:hypothetical protein
VQGSGAAESPRRDDESSDHVWWGASLDGHVDPLSDDAGGVPEGGVHDDRIRVKEYDAVGESATEHLPEATQGADDVQLAVGDACRQVLDGEGSPLEL